MTADTEIIAFLNARLDEDEATAKAGARRIGMPWRSEPQPGTPGGLVLDDLGLVGSTGGRYAADHIARHDPARALREVAAKRAIVAEHRQGDNDSIWCHRCDPGADMNDDRAYYPCFVIQHLAAVHSDHPDYRAEWAPGTALAL